MRHCQNNSSTLFTHLEALNRFPGLFDDAHCHSTNGGGGGKPHVDDLSTAVYSYSGELTIGHGKRKSRGVCFAR